MESPILNRIAEFLQEQKTHKRWRVVFVIMAVFVGVGTVTALRMMGLAMTHKERALDCQLELHKHDKSCYDSDKNLICGYADYVVHKHNDDCYNADLKLVCKLPEIEKHEHTKACYDRVAVLVCGQEEAAGHEHTDACYTTQKGDLKCKEPEHQHDDGCYDEEGNLTCGMEEHQHDDDCYKWDDVLTCKVKEGEGGHGHTDKCYEIQEGLICGELEMHTHTDKCFEKIDKKGKDEPGNLRLICEEIQLEEHVHTEAAGCLKTVEAVPDGEIAQTPEDGEDTADASSDGSEVFTTDLGGEGTDGEAAEGEDGKDGEGTEGEDGETPDGEDAEGEGTEDGETVEDAGTDEGTDGEAIDAEPEDYEFSKTYEGLGYIITAAYNEDANIPEEAKLVAEQITEESDKENYKTHEEEFKKNMGEEEATLSALFKIGFYVDGEEVEPESPVLVTIQFVDKNGLPEGAPVKVVHFGDEGTEVIDGSNASGGSTSFRTNGFSIFGVGVSKEADAKEASVHISESYEYEDAVFHITFQVEGDAKILDGSEKASESEKKDEETTDPKEESGDTDDEAVDESDEVKAEEKAETAEEESETAEEKEPEAAKEEKEVKKDDSEEQKLEFKVEKLDENSEEYKEAVKHVESENNGDELLLIQPLTYSMYLDGEELDISACKVTAKVETAEALKRRINNSVPEALSYIREEAGLDYSGSAVEDDLQTEFTVSILRMNANAVNEVARMDVNANSMNKGLDVDVSDEGDNSNSIAPFISTQANPEFTVQYYAKLDRVKLDDTGKLPVIDTEGGVLPQNGITPNTKTISLNSDGTVQTLNQLTKVYESRNFEYIKAPTLKYFNALVDNTSYELKAIWICRHVHEDNLCYTKGEDGKKILTCTKADSIEKDDWISYPNEKIQDISDLHFTNRKVTAGANEEYVWITQNTTIRLIYDAVKKPEESFNSVFYDYDISTGNHTSKNGAIVMETASAGINHQDNCAENPKYAFGNNSMGTKYGTNVWKGNFLNKANKDGTTFIGYAGCTFGLVDRADGEKVVFNVGAPEIFGSTKQEGKTIYSNQYDLNFVRTGDTYTFTSVAGTNVAGLDKFKNPQSKYPNIWTNNFWPMDEVDSAGTAGHDIKFGGPNYQNQKRTGGGVVPSDDGTDHNSYFGMYYEIPFTIPEDYVGPLEYLFFGDDDMWVFLDDETLVCDIGGVHSSVGEYVNLWDYLKDENGKIDAGEHTLKFFYTERGASGSTCWMHFTLPSVTSKTPETSSKDYGQLRIEKKVESKRPDLLEDSELEERLNRDTFKFKLDIEGAKDDYSYTKYEYDDEAEEGFRKIEDNLIIWDGGSFTLKNNQYIIVNYLPQDAEYTITESDAAIIVTRIEDENGEDKIVETPSDEIYATDIESENVLIETEDNVIIEELIKGTKQKTENLLEDKTIEGKIPANGMSKVYYTNKFDLYQLPETGGSGIMIYTIAGALCILLGAGFMYRKKAKERRA